MAMDHHPGTAQRCRSVDANEPVLVTDQSLVRDEHVGAQSGEGLHIVWEDGVTDMQGAARSAIALPPSGSEHRLGGSDTQGLPPRIGDTRCAP
jgi:hypothetical protein